MVAAVEADALGAREAGMGGQFGRDGWRMGRRLPGHQSAQMGSGCGLAGVVVVVVVVADVAAAVAGSGQVEIDPVSSLSQARR